MKPDPTPERVDAEALLRDFDDALRASEADPRLFAIIEHDVERLARERDEAERRAERLDLETTQVRAAHDRALAANSILDERLAASERTLEAFRFEVAAMLDLDAKDVPGITPNKARKALRKLNAAERERDEALSLLTEATDEVANMLCVRAIREASGPRNVEYAEGVIQRARALLARHGEEAAR